MSTACKHGRYISRSEGGCFQCTQEGIFEVDKRHSARWAELKETIEAMIRLGMARVERLELTEAQKSQAWGGIRSAQVIRDCMKEIEEESK